MTDQEVFANRRMTIGCVNCSADAPSFSVPGYVRGYRIVFPCQGVWIHPGHLRPYLSDPTVVEYYNDGDQFSRRAFDPRGDRTHWYRIDEDDVRDAVRQYDVAAADARSPFRFTHGPTDPHAYLAQRALFRRLMSHQRPTELETAEAVFDVLDRVLARAYRLRAAIARQPITRDERDMAERAAGVLSGMTSGRATLTAIGRAAGVSVFHLSRIFRKVTGSTLAKHHLHLRLLASLDPLGDSDATIHEIATTHGFAGHSHYSSVFRRVLGTTPSEYRHQSAASRRRAIRGARQHTRVTDVRRGSARP